jgi:MFS family permease
LNSAIFTGAALIGPALAGALLVPLGAASLFLVNGISFLAMLAALYFLTGVPANGGGKQMPFTASMLAGLSYAWRNKLSRVLFILFAFTAIFGRSYQGLLPIFARDLWHGGPTGYGFLLSSSGAGALVGAFGLASLKELTHRERTLIASGLVFALSLILFAVSPSLLLGSLFLFTAGVAATAFGTLVATFIQVMTPNELRGRVMSLYTVCLIGLPSLGALCSGVVAEMFGGIAGAPRAVLLGALLMGAIVLAFAPFILRKGGDG